MTDRRPRGRPRKTPAMSTPSTSTSMVSRSTQAPEQYLITEKLLDIPITPLVIPGFGGVSFPVNPQIANYLKPRMRPSTYGFDGQRLLDPAVRNSYELAAVEFKIENPSWANYLNEVVLPKVAEGLKVDYCHLEAKMTKFLLYEKGSFFDNHTDSAKDPGSFGTLIIQLPSKYTGGQFVATLDGTTWVIDHSSSVTGSANEFSGFLIAFSLGVEHRVKVVTEGYRSCLIFDLIDTRSRVANVVKKPRVEPPYIEVDSSDESDHDRPQSHWSRERKVAWYRKHRPGQIFGD